MDALKIPQKYQAFFKNSLLKKEADPMVSLIEEKNHYALSQFITQKVPFTKKAFKMLDNDFYSKLTDKKLFIEVNRELIKECIKEDMRFFNKRLQLASNYALLPIYLPMQLFGLADFGDDKKIKRTRQRLKLYESLFSSLELKQTDAEFIKDIYESMNYYTKKNKSTLLFYFQNTLVDLRRDAISCLYNEVFSGDLKLKIEKIKMEQLQSSQEIASKILSLPPAAKKMSETIQSSFLYLSAHHENLPPLLKAQYDTLSSRFPQVLKEYHNIPQEYKEKLSKEENNPDTLLLEALTSVHQKLDTIKDNIGENHLHQLKVSTQYLKKSL